MMLTFWIILVWLVYAGINIALAWWNNEIRESRIRTGNKKQIEHPLWGLFYCVLCVPMYWPGGILFVLSVLLLHLSVFPVAYNRLAAPSAFYLSKTTTAITDRLMIAVGLKSSASVNIGAFIVSIFLVIKSIL